MPSTKEILKSSPPFDEIDDATVDQFLQSSEEVSFKKDGVIMVEHAVNDKIYFILEGTIHGNVAWASEDRSIELSKGQFFGLNAFVDEEDGLTTASVAAETDVRLLVWKAASWKEICDLKPTIGYKVAFFVAQSLNQRIKRWLIIELNNLSWGIE